MQTECCNFNQLIFDLCNHCLKVWRFRNTIDLSQGCVPTRCSTMEWTKLSSIWKHASKTILLVSFKINTVILVTSCLHIMSKFRKQKQSREIMHMKPIILVFNSFFYREPRLTSACVAEKYPSALYSRSCCGRTVRQSAIGRITVCHVIPGTNSRVAGGSRGSKELTPRSYSTFAW